MMIIFFSYNILSRFFFNIFVTGEQATDVDYDVLQKSALGIISASTATTVTGFCGGIIYSFVVVFVSFF